MLIATQGDARTALDGLLTDIQATIGQVSAANASSNWFTGFFGADAVASSAATLLQQLSAAATSAAAAIDGDDGDPVTPDQVARLKELQQEVISDRKLVQQAISSVDWTFGDFLADVGTTTVNLASQTVAAVAQATGVNWTWVKIGVAAIGVVLVYALYSRVSGR